MPKGFTKKILVSIDTYRDLLEKNKGCQKIRGVQTKYNKSVGVVNQDIQERLRRLDKSKTEIQKGDDLFNLYHPAGDGSNDKLGRLWEWIVTHVPGIKKTQNIIRMGGDLKYTPFELTRLLRYATGGGRIAKEKPKKWFKFALLIRQYRVPKELLGTASREVFSIWEADPSDDEFTDDSMDDTLSPGIVPGRTLKETVAERTRNKKAKLDKFKKMRAKVQNPKDVEPLRGYLGSLFKYVQAPSDAPAKS